MSTEVIMTEDEINVALEQMENSEEYLALKEYCAEESFIKILHASRDELVHSNFIAWLLSPTSRHELNYFPLRQFLKMLPEVVGQNNNQKFSLSEDYCERFSSENYELKGSCEVQTEVPTGAIAGFDDKGRIDILIYLSFENSDKKIPIIIENKVLSTENKKKKKNKNGTEEESTQTKKYSAWADIKYQDKTEYEEPILIFLAPDIGRDIECSCEKFIKVSYQNLVDYLIEPCLEELKTKELNNQTKSYIEHYLRCLSNTTLSGEDYKKEGIVMAYGTKETKLVKDFYNKHRGLFLTVCKVILDTSSEEDYEGGSAEKEDLEKIKKLRSQYSFNGQIDGIGRTVLAVVKEHVSKNPGITFEKLKEAFPAELQGSRLGVVCKKNDVDDKHIDRYFAKPEEIIELESGDEVLVSNQWGNNFPKFLKQAQDLGYEIERVQ